jgi:hypothetical protein
MKDYFNRLDFNGLDFNGLDYASKIGTKNKKKVTFRLTARR